MMRFVATAIPCAQGQPRLLSSDASIPAPARRSSLAASTTGSAVVIVVQRAPSLQTVGLDLAGSFVDAVVRLGSETRSTTGRWAPAWDVRRSGAAGLADIQRFW